MGVGSECAVFGGRWGAPHCGGQRTLGERMALLAVPVLLALQLLWRWHMWEAEKLIGSALHSPAAVLGEASGSTQKGLNSSPWANSFTP